MSDGEKSMLEQYKEMTGANQFLAEHCGKTMEEQVKLLRGASHSVNRCNAEYAALFDTVKIMATDLIALENKLSEANAAIGKLQEQVKSLEESIGKAREAYAQLKKSNGNPKVTKGGE